MPRSLLLGLQRPLAYFPRSSMAYGEARFKGQPPEQALLAAESAWWGRPGVPGEQDKAEWRVCFRDQPLGADFRLLAETLWLPLLEALAPDDEP